MEREIREDLIIDAARTVFGAKTYDKVSMQEIANAAGIAKSSIYTYFKNQEALFVEAAYRDTQRFISELETRLQEKDDAQKLDALIAHFLEYNTRNEVYWQMITRFSLYGEISGESSRKLDVVARRFMDLLDLVFSGAPSRGRQTPSVTHAFCRFERHPDRFSQIPGAIRRRKPGAHAAGGTADQGHVRRLPSAGR